MSNGNTRRRKIAKFDVEDDELVAEPLEDQKHLSFNPSKGMKTVSSSSSNADSNTSITIFDSTIQPVVSGIYDLGSDESKFRSGYFGCNLYCSNLVINEIPLSSYQTDVPDGSVSTQKIMDAAVTMEKLAFNSVGSNHIIDGSIISSKLAPSISVSNIGINTSSPQFPLDVNGSANISGNTTIGGNLIVNGTSTVIDTQSLLIEDNILLINTNQTGTPPTFLQSGIEVERGDQPNYFFVFDENTDLFKVGVSNQLQAVSTRDDVMQSGYAYFDSQQSKIVNKAFTTSDFNNSIVTSNLIADSNVTSAKIGANTVVTANIADGAVTTVKILDSNITSAKIGANTVVTANIADNSVTSAKLSQTTGSGLVVLNSNPSFDGHTLLQSASVAGIDLIEKFSSSSNESASNLNTFATVPSFDQTWTSVCWSPQRGIFVAVSATGTDRVMISKNGQQWTSVNVPSTCEWMDVCWSPQLELFVAVAWNIAPGPAAMTSPDGINWTIRTTPVGSWYSVCWSPQLNIFVATAISSTFRVMTSPDGINWTGRSAPGSGWRQVCWSPELRLFVAVSNISGGLNGVMTSPDGINWTQRSVPEDNGWMTISWSPQRRIFVVLGQLNTNRIMTSPDGINWTAYAPPVANSWRIVRWVPELYRFVALSVSGTNNRIMSSLDGVSWIVHTNTIANEIWRGLCWSPELSILVAVGESGVGKRVMVTNPAVTSTLNTILSTTGQINSNQILDGSVTFGKLANNSVGSNQIIDGSVSTNKIIDNSITTSKIQDSNVTSAKIGAGTIVTANIADASITTAKLNAVTGTGTVVLNTAPIVSNLTSSGTLTASNATASNIKIKAPLAANPASDVDVNGSILTKTLLTYTSSVGNSNTRPPVGTSVLDGQIHAYGCITSGSFPRTAADDGFLRLSAGGGTGASRSFIDLSGFNQVADMNRNIVFGTANTERMRIVESGNIGIGTTAPTQKLDVNGSVNITNDLIVGGNLTVNGTSTTIDTVTLTVEDNIIMLNKNQTGTPSTILQSGIEVERGDLANYLFVFDEATDLFKVGVSGSLQAVMTRDDVMTSGYAYYDSAQSKVINKPLATSDLPDNIITSSKILDSSVTSAKIGAGTIVAANVADGAITTAKFLDGSVTTAKIADNAVTTAKILDGNVTSAKIGANNVTSVNIASNAVTTVKILDSNVTSAKIGANTIVVANIADGAITTSKILDGNVTAAKILDANITTSKIADNAVTTAKILDGNVTAAKVANSNITESKIDKSTVGIFNVSSSNIYFTTNSNAGSGSVGIGTSTPSYKLQVVGTIHASGDIIGYSDIRFKKDLQIVENPLEKIKALNGYTYTRVDDPEGGRKMGVIAQEVEKVAPEVISKNAEGYLSVAYGNLAGLFIEALKELNAKLDKLSAEVHDHISVNS